MFSVTIMETSHQMKKQVGTERSLVSIVLNISRLVVCRAVGVDKTFVEEILCGGEIDEQRLYGEEDENIEYMMKLRQS